MNKKMNLTIQDLLKAEGSIQGLDPSKVYVFKIVKNSLSRDCISNISTILASYNIKGLFLIVNHKDDFTIAEIERMYEQAR